LDEPVGNVVAVNAETDEQHDMVDLLVAAVKRADDTAGVELEGKVKGVHADGHGALLEQGHDRAGVVDLSVGHAGRAHDGAGGGHRARVVVGLERRSSLCWGGLPIVERVFWSTSEAALVTGYA